MAAQVLRSGIPLHGRKLTRAEVRDLRARNHLVRYNAFVVRQSTGSDLYGYVYNPTNEIPRRFASANVIVTKI